MEFWRIPTFMVPSDAVKETFTFRDVGKEGRGLERKGAGHEEKARGSMGEGEGCGEEGKSVGVSSWAWRSSLPPAPSSIHPGLRISCDPTRAERPASPLAPKFPFRAPAGSCSERTWKSASGSVWSWRAVRTVVQHCRGPRVPPRKMDLLCVLLFMHSLLCISRWLARFCGVESWKKLDSFSGDLESSLSLEYLAPNEAEKYH